MNIAILSTGPKLYSTRRLKEAGEKRGHRVEIIDHMKCVLYIEKQNPVVLYQGRKLDYFDAIIPRIGASVTFYGAAVVRQFEMMKVFTAVESQALIRSRDKLRSLQILSRAGLGLPKTIFMDYSKDTEGVVVAVGGAPEVIKLLEGTQGLGVVLAENKKAAQSVIEAFHGVKTRIIVQEFIKEAYRVLKPGGVLAVIGHDPHEEGVSAWYIYTSFDGVYATDKKRYPVQKPHSAVYHKSKGGCHVS